MSEGLDEDEEPGEHVDEEERIPLSDLRKRIEAEKAAETEPGDVSEDAPLSKLAKKSQSTTESERSELFEEVDIGDIDAEAVWDAVVEEGMPPDDVLGEANQTAPVDLGAAGSTETPDEHVINKREYCQRCEFFNDPPDVACTNAGTDILELVDNEHFRVRNCPKVEAAENELSSVVEE